MLGLELRRFPTHVALLTLALAGAPACDSSEDDGDGDGGGDGGGSTDPASGTWVFSGGPVSDDTCMYEEVYVDPPGTFLLANNGDGTFTIDDGENVFDCELDGADYSCPSRLTGNYDVGEELGIPADAILSYNVSVSGTFDGASVMSGRQDVEVTCEGADCGTLAGQVGLTLPCGWAQEFTAAAS